LHETRLRIGGPVVAAAELHLDLLTIHPFPDGNGRTARTMEAAELARAGFRSTIFTAVDQRFEVSPRMYVELLDAFGRARICRSACVAGMLIAMATRSYYVLQLFGRYNLRRSAWLCVTRAGETLATIMAPAIHSLSAPRHDQESWAVYRARLPPDALRELNDQCSRMRSERDQDLAPGDDGVVFE
jgi:hypothetical protein